MGDAIICECCGKNAALCVARWACDAYPHIVVDEITKLVEILNERERELTNQGDQLG